MSCTTLEGISKSCDNNIGGIKKVWIWDMDDKVIANSVDNPTTWEWDSYEIASVPEGYEFIRNSSNYTEEATIDLANGSSFVTTTLTLVFTRREALKSRAIKILGEGQRYLGALVLDSNGIYWLFEDLQLSASTEGSGTAKADGSKYNVTLLGEVADFAKVVTTENAALLIEDGSFIITSP
jgi:hypothetical protein